jgi:phosphatidylinositol glycan class V
MSNIPLFLLASPMLCILLISAVHPFRSQTEMQVSAKSRAAAAGENDDNVSKVDAALLHRMALPQLLLSVLAITSFHVQIVNRISSGYPLWYLFVASHFLSSSKASPGVVGKIVSAVPQASMMYAMIQGALFSAFLPPA